MVAAEHACSRRRRGARTPQPGHDEVEWRYSLSEYELRFLAEHLEAAGRDEALHRLVSLTTADGRNAWAVAKEALSDPHGADQGFLDDVAVAWRCADHTAMAANADPARRASAFALQCRYSLVTASVVSIA